MRPTGSVSGDFYDVYRLDEKHYGFYVADAVGHGMPAALLTMFIKRAMQTKRIVGNSYEIVAPNECLAQLNADLCEQDLSSCQFCTAVYGVVDTGDLTLTFSRAGHPPPALIREGTVEFLEAPGSLLGVFPEESFEVRQAQLRPGDQVLFYSDGAEEALCWQTDGKPRDLRGVLSAWADAPRELLLGRIAERVDLARRGPGPRDDATAVVLEIR
jgi:sigma-B regulation protein RsbU (phosphoserine phosphatase)